MDHWPDLRRAVAGLWLLGLCLYGAAAAPADTLNGLWGCSLYHVQLSVNGTTVTGAVTSLADPDAPAGSLTGQLQREGRALLADWTIPLGADTGSFQTWLSLNSDGSLLQGLRWSEGSVPTAFALHRAVDGQIPDFPVDDEPVGPPPEDPPPALLTAELKGPGDSVPIKLPRGYPRTAVRLELTVNYTAPGTILDTVGLNVAPVGAFALVVNADGRIALNLFDPGRPSPRRDTSGWHRLISAPAAAGVDHRVRVEQNGAELVLTVDEVDQRVALPTPLSGQPVFLGDFPGDAGWAPRLETKLGMTGRVVLHSFGPSPTPARRAPE